MDMTCLLQKTCILASTEMRGCVPGGTRSYLARLPKAGNTLKKTAFGFSLKHGFAVQELSVKV